MKLLGKNEIDEIGWQEPHRQNGEFYFVKRLVQQGPTYFVSNAHVSARAIEIDGRLIPLVLSDGNPGDATVCSLQAHYAESPYRQLSQLGNPFYSAIARPFLGLLRCVIRAGRLGRVVYLNDWLMTTNPHAQLSANQIEAVTNLLISQFPDRAIVFRSVNQRTQPGLQCALLEKDYRLIRSRRIYIFSPKPPDFRMKENLRKDLRLLKRWPGTIKKAPLDDQSIQRVVELYRGLYLRKYSSGNPDFTTEFFRTVINEGLFEFRCLEQDGEILAFTAWKTGDDSMLGTLIGYDLERPREMGLFRMAFAIDFKESLDRGVPYHLSSGAGYFKRLRGAVPATEYDAIFSRHLPRKPRSFWTLFRALMYLAERSEGERIDFKKAPKKCE